MYETTVLCIYMTSKNQFYTSEKNEN